MSKRKQRVLISTIKPGSGGVPVMARFVAGLLEKHGHEPVIAHYEPYSNTPNLSVPSFRLLQRAVASEPRTAFDHCEAHAIGAWLPELEFTHYLATSHWRKLMDSCDAHVMVSGNILAATPYWQTGRPYLAWVATDWAGDRKDRTRNFSWPRKLLDKAVNGPVIKQLEKKLLKSGRILALSEYTARTLAAIAGTEDRPDVLGMPVETDVFVVRSEATAPRRIGFTGRYDDPRKNIGLLLDAMSLLKQKGESVSAVLIGGQPNETILERVIRLGLKEQVTFVPQISRDELVRQVQALDVFVLPSHQEGLCISALEAMACGVPVVSTRCGGPEEFVIDGGTGLLVDNDPGQMAQAIQTIVGDRELRARLSQAARRLAVKRYAIESAEEVFMAAFDKTFPQLQQG